MKDFAICIRQNSKISIHHFRSVQLFFEKHVVYDSIPAYRYKIGSNFLNDLDDCFCTDKIKGTLKHEDGCLYNGALDLYDCLGN